MMKFCYAIKSFSALLATVLGMSVFAATPAVTAVTAQQRYPWNGLVDIVVTFSGVESDVAKATCTFAATNSETKAALAIAHITKVGTDSGSGNIWTRRFIWDTNADVGEVKIADVELFTIVEAVEESSGSGGVQLWDSGPYWAECNVGASKPEEYGSYFMWGDIEGHRPTGDKFGDEWFVPAKCATYRMSTAELFSQGYIDSTGSLAATHDAATVHRGAPWRMPTDNEFSRLMRFCDVSWTTKNGICGWLATGRGTFATKSIFLPASGLGSGSTLYGAGSGGLYWTSTRLHSRSSSSYCLSFNSYEIREIEQSYTFRYTGGTIRPIRWFSDPCYTTTFSIASTHLLLDNKTGIRVVGAFEKICFSPVWETDAASAIARVSTNGVVVVSASEAGTFEWTPTQSGTYQFTHTVFVNGVQVGETLSATFIVGDLQPISADWSAGSIALQATGVEMVNGESVWLSYADANADNASWEYVANCNPVWSDDWLSVCVTDPEFSSRLGGLPAIRYRIQLGKSIDEIRKTLDCVTRTRRGIFVGVGEFGSDYEVKQEPLPDAPKNAKKFCDLMRDKGMMADGDYRVLTNSDATYAKVDSAFSEFADVVKPGDIVVVYFSTHGNVIDETTIGKICLYDKPPIAIDPQREGYHEALLYKHIRMLDPENKGVAVVSIMSACHSGAFIDDSKDEFDCCDSLYLKENLSAANVAWFTAATYKVSAYPYFDDFLLEYGWDGGWADDNIDGAVSFLELANYTKKQYDKLFSGILFEEENEAKQAQISNAVLLNKIVAGSCATHVEKKTPSVPLNVSADKGKSRDSITIRWDGDSAADEYCIFYRFGAKNSDGEINPYIGIRSTKEVFYNFAITEKNQQAEDEYADFLFTNASWPALFIIKALNGAGISEASTETDGWVNALLKKVIFEGNGGDIPNSWDGTPIGGTQWRVSTWIEQGEKLWRVPTVDRSGYTFCGWFNGANIATPETVVQDDVTYTARWTDMTAAYLESYPKIAAVAGNDIATAANLTAANGSRTVGECYALGIDPEDPNDDLSISEFEIVNGSPVITLNHTKDALGNSFEPRIKTLGKANLSDADWVDVTDMDKSAFRFFKVKVDLP